MEDPIVMSTTNLEPQKDISPFESEACENYLKGFQLNIEELVTPAEPKETKPDPDENQSGETVTTPGKIQSRRPTLEINGVQVKPKTLAEYREAIKLNSENKRKSLDGQSSDEIVNDENKTKIKNLRRHTIESPPLSEKKNVKVLGEHCNKKMPKSDNSPKVTKVKEELTLSNENTVTRSGRVSKKVLKTEKVKEKHKKQDDEDTDKHTEVVSRKVAKQSHDHFSSDFLVPDNVVDIKSVDSNVIMYTGAGRHLHSYAIHNYNLLTENTFDVSSWQRDFALTALNNNIDSSGRSIYRSTVPLVSKKLIQIRNQIKEGKFSSMNNTTIKTESSKNEKLPNRPRRRKKRKTVWTKQKTHSTSALNAKKLKEEDGNDVSLDSDKDNENNLEMSTSKNKDESMETTPELCDEVKTLKRKLNPNEEDDLYWEMYGTPHKRVKLKLIQTQSDSNKKPKWTSVNYERENRPEETEEEVADIVSTVMGNMVNYVEFNNEYNEKDITMDPTYSDEYKLESEDTSELPKQHKRKRNNSSRVKWELKRLDVLIFEHESEASKNGDGTCSNDFCKLGCICESISVRPKNIAINHCSEINCIFKCICPAPRRNEHKPPIRDESEIIRSVAEKRNGRNLAKKEKEWIQTLVKTNDEYIIMEKTSGNKSKREVKKPERYREESLHWENVAHQKFLYEKVKRSLREKAKKTSKDDLSQSTEDSNESTTLSSKERKRAEMKLMKRLRKKKRMQEMSQSSEENKQPTKTSPFKFYFCKEHSVLDCKCKAKKETKEEENEVESRLKEINEQINTLSSNLGNLSSKEKDKLLSLLREQQTLTENKPEQSNEKVTESKEEPLLPPPSTDEEYIDLNTLSKFIPNPDGNTTPPEPKQDMAESMKTSEEKSHQPEVEAADASRLSDDIEIVPTDEQPDAKTNSSMSTDSTTDDSMPRIKIKSVRSLQAEEFDKMVAAEEDKCDDEIEVIATRTVTSNGNIVTSRQNIPGSSINPIQSLLNQNGKASIDFYGFMLHTGIGYLPISQYSPKKLYLIFKDPTKKDPLPIIFHGADYLQKASTWANGFLNGYVKFHPKYTNPCWKIIKFSTMQELKNWKLFDFKFLKDYAPMILTNEGIYKVKEKILYKLLLLPKEKVFKFKQVMEAKLDMDDISFIEKYEYFHNCRDNLPNKPIRFIQRLQVLNDKDGTNGDPAENEASRGTPSNMEPSDSNNSVSNASPNLSTSLPTPSPPGHKGIFLKPPESLLQRIPAAPSSGVTQKPPRTTNLAVHRNNIISNLNRLAMSRMRSAGMNPARGTSVAGNNPGLTVNNPGITGNNPSLTGNNVTLPGNKPSQGGFNTQGTNNLLQGGFYGMQPNVNLPARAPLNPMKPPPGYPLSAPVVKVNNLEKYGKFIQISDLIAPNANQPRQQGPSSINQSHPILTKSLTSPVAVEKPDTAVCIEKLPAEPTQVNENDIEMNLDTYKISKMTNVASADTANNPSANTVPNMDTSEDNTNMDNLNLRTKRTYIRKSNVKRTREKPVFNYTPRFILPNTLETLRNVMEGNLLGSGNITQNPIPIPIDSSLVSSIIPIDANLISPKNLESAFPRTSTSPGNLSSPRTVTSPRKAPVPGLKPIKKPLPALKAISEISYSPVVPKKLTEEVDISMSPVKSHSVSYGSSSEPECVVEEVSTYRTPRRNGTPEISIVECLTQMDNKFTPITITPNGEDTVTISPIIVNNNNNNNTGSGKEKIGGTVFERLSAIKRLNDGEPLAQVARSMNISADTLTGWLRNFDKLQKRTGNRTPAFPFTAYTPES
ncbi:hypothetical protein M8J75_002204 [Diaphorina citri]|nr:hypothetical protein M8J75_002204 [Diaphorina citri]